MKFLFAPLLLLFFLFSCKQTDTREKYLQDQIDRLQSKLENTYSPGFGDFMGSIQNHHNKLWFAGINENWKLADFEMHELEEMFDEIKTTYPDREETQSLPLIEPGLTAVNTALKQQDLEAFKQGYTALTNACNRCHQATKHEFIKITLPTVPSYSNQDYTGKRE